MMIRPMKEADVECVAELEKLCFSEPWSADDLRSSMNASCVFFVALENPDSDKIMGYVGAQISIDEMEITDIAVFPEARRKGVARELLQAVHTEAKTRALSGVVLEVRVSNVAAITLYESMGYMQEGLRKNIYQFPKEDGLIMWKRAPF